MALKKLFAACALVAGLVATDAVAMAGVYSGVYAGAFSENAGNGGFVLMVNDNDVAVLLAYEFSTENGFDKTGITINADGSFRIPNVDGEGTTVNGTILAGTSVSGTFTGPEGAGTFSGTALPNTGVFSGNGGYYTGTGQTVPAQCFGLSLAISLHALISADGLVYFYGQDSEGFEDAGITTISANGQFAGTTLQGDRFVGAVSDGGAGTTITGSGTEFDVEGNCRYTFTLRRAEALPTMFGEAPPGDPSSHDFTGDRKSDVLIRNTSTGQWFMYPMDGRNVLSGPDRGPVKLTGSQAWQLVGVADLTGDGKADILVRNTSTGQWFLYPMNGRSVMNDADRGPVKLTGNLTWQAVGVADLTGDGKADVLVRNTSTGRWFLYPMDGRTVVFGPDRGPAKLTSDQSWEPVGVADFTGDGKADVLVRDTDTGQWFMYPMSGRDVLNGPDRGPVKLIGSLGWTLVGAADLTGDRKADVLVRDTMTGKWFVYPMDGRTVVNNADRGPAALPSDLALSVQQVEDFTGDGKADVLLRDMDTGEWFMSTMNGRRVVGGANAGELSLTGNIAWETQ